MEKFYRRDASELSWIFDFLKTKSVNFLNQSLFFNKLNPFLIDDKFQKTFFQQILFVELLYLYNSALDMAAVYKNKTDVVVQCFLEKEQLLFFVGSLYSVIKSIEGKIPPETIIISLSEFPKVLDYHIVENVPLSMKIASDIYLTHKHEIVEKMRLFRFYAEGNRLQGLSCAQLFFIALKMFEIKKEFKSYGDRSKDYFGMIFYKEICQEISGSSCFSAEIDFFSIILDQLKVKAESLADLDSNAGHHLFISLFVLCETVFSISHKMKIMEVMSVLFEKIFGKSDASKKLNKFLDDNRSGRALSKATDFGVIDLYNVFIEDLDDMERALKHFWLNTPQDPLSSQGVINFPGERIKIQAPSAAMVLTSEVIDWNRYVRFLKSGKMPARLAMAKTLLNNPHALHEGVLLMSCLFLNALQSADSRFVEENIAHFLYLLSTQLTLVVFDDTAEYDCSDYLWETMLHAMSLAPQSEFIKQGFSEDMRDYIEGTLALLQSFYDNGMLLPEKNKQALRMQVRQAEDLFRSIHPQEHNVSEAALKTAVVVSKELFSPKNNETEKRKELSEAAVEVVHEAATQCALQLTEFKSPVSVLEDTGSEQAPWVERKARAPKKQQKKSYSRQVLHSQNASQASTAQVSVAPPPLLINAPAVVNASSVSEVLASSENVSLVVDASAVPCPLSSLANASNTVEFIFQTDSVVEAPSIALTIDVVSEGTTIVEQSVSETVLNTSDIIRSERSTSPVRQNIVETDLAAKVAALELEVQLLKEQQRQNLSAGRGRARPARRGEAQQQQRYPHPIPAFVPPPAAYYMPPPPPLLTWAPPQPLMWALPQPLMWALPPPSQQQWPSHEPAVDGHGNHCVRVRMNPNDPGTYHYNIHVRPK